MVAYMMAAKFMHVNLKSIIDTTTTTPPSPAAATLPDSHLARTSAERSTIHNNTKKYTLPPIISKSDQLPSPPTSPKAYSDSDPLNYHYFQSPRKNSINNTNTLPPLQNDRHFQILRMELEFLHFLNYDLSLTDTLKWIRWAQSFQDDTGVSSDTSDTDEFHYTSADEGDDEQDAEGH